MTVPHRAGAGRSVLASLVLAAAALVTLDVAGVGGPTEVVRDGVQAVTAPPLRLVGGAVAPAGDALARLAGDAPDVSALSAENAELRSRLARSESDARRAGELDALLRAPTVERYPSVPARVLGLAGATDAERTAVLDAGSRDGLADGTAVLSGGGLVGRLRGTGPWTSSVLLLSDPSSAVGVRVQGTGEVGELRGEGGDELRLRLFDPRAAVARGDRLVTVGAAGSPFVPDVPVGVVTEVAATPGSPVRTATVSPFADLTALDTVAVVLPQARAEPRAPLPVAPEGP